MEQTAISPIVTESKDYSVTILDANGRVVIDSTDGQPRIADVSYEGQGCSISQASTSVLTELVVGRTVTDALAVQAEFLRLMQGGGEPDEEILEDAVAFAGVAKYPSRIKCALLGWMAWKDATAQAVAVTAQ